MGHADLVADLPLPLEVRGVLVELVTVLPAHAVDDQVAVAFRCGSSDAILLTANCFITEIPELVTVPLDEDWSEEYGVIYRPHPSSVVQKYIDLAVEVYRDYEREQADL